MSRFRTLAVGAIVGFGALLFSAAPAFAHDELVESTPADQAQVTVAPASIQLRFSADIMAADSGTEVVVSDSTGANRVAGAPVIDGDLVTVPLQPSLPAGQYNVQWRVVSSDSHPIDGTFSFTATEGAAPASPTAAPSTEPAATPSATETSAAPVMSKTAEPANEANHTSGAFIAVVIGAAVVIVATIVYAASSARRRKLDADDHAEARATPKDDIPNNG